jgi:predicted amidohydrolase
MDCRLGDRAGNLGRIRDRLAESAAGGARLTVFPECALTGYCFESLQEALHHGEPLPGPASRALAEDCRRLGIWAIFGLLEASADNRLYNACALVGPAGLAASYRKIHLPFLGVDRFTTPGDRPFAVHEIDDLRLGLNICYDGSFPEAARILALLGADLVALPTNWPTGASGSPRFLVPARALENHIYYAAANRVGEERGFRFIGQSRIVDFDGEPLAVAGDGEEIIYAKIDPELARAKRVIQVPGKYEIDRIGHRRPEMYEALVRQDGVLSEREPLQ